MMIRILLVSFLFSLCNYANAEEKILSYHSDITVNRDGSLHVIENILVQAENRQIRHGIYRDFPTVYQSKMGTTTRVGFELLSVKKDGVKEDYRTSKLSNGIRIYIGNAQVSLAPGKYAYQLEYLTTRQLGFFDKFDELYWNVTGNGWIFPIDLASASISLPQTVASSQVEMTGYTGVQGSRDQYLTHHIVDGNEFYFETTQPLRQHEGLTIVLDWPKGIVKEPSAQQRREFYLQDNLHNVYALGGLAVVILYYLLVWLKVGKDPDKGVIIPRYQAPQGLSPASIRFINNMQYDDKCFSAALVNLAIKGAITIEQTSSGKFKLTRNLDSNPELAAGEAIVLRELFDEGETITLQQSEHTRIGSARRRHEASLYQNYEKLYYLSNTRYFTPGILISIAAIVLSFSKIPDEDMLASTLFVGIFSMIPFVVLGITFMRYLKNRKTMSLVQIGVQLLVMGIFFNIAGDLIRQVLQQLDMVAWPMLISAYLVIASNVLFQQWLKAPTLAGRKLMDQIEGFKLYLNVAEEDEIKLADQPKFTSDVFEQFLPFAIALGVENAWSNRLDNAIAAGVIAASYQPNGLLMHNRYHSFSSFSENLSQGMTSAVSSSKSAPGSSSGSSSSGSSGGGGGGGGGGGW